MTFHTVAPAARSGPSHGVLSVITSREICPASHALISTACLPVGSSQANERFAEVPPAYHPLASFNTICVAPGLSSAARVPAVLGAVDANDVEVPSP